MTIRLISAVTLCAALAAQDKVSPNRFVPDDSLVVARVAAPAAWKQQFGKSLVARLFEQQTLAPLVAQATAAFDAGLEQAKQEGKIAPELIDGLVADYTGQIVMSLQLDAADLVAAMSEDRPPAISCVIALTPDGKYDLQALAEGVQKLAEEEHGELRDLTVGDHRLRYVATDDVQHTLPFLVDGHLVVLLGNDLEKDAAKLLAADDRFAHESSEAPLFLHVRLGRAIDALLEAAGAQLEVEGGGMPFDPIALLRDGIGLGCLGTLDMTVTPADEHVLIETTVTARDGERGLFGTMLLDQGPPKLLRFVPPGADEFGCVPFDFGAIYRAVAKLWGDLADAVPMTFDEAEKAFAEATTVRLKEDLVDQLGTELLSLSDTKAQLEAMAEAEGDEPDPAAMFAGSCYAIALRDGKAFGESLEKALRARGLHAARKTDEYQGVKVHRLRLAAVFELEYAVTDEMLLLAPGGETGAQRLRAILDARAAAPTAPPESVLKRVEGLPAGWNGVGVTPVAATLRGIGSMLGKLLERGQLPEDAGMVPPILSGVAGDLERLGIGEMFGAVYTSKDAIVTRVRW